MFHPLASWQQAFGLMALFASMAASLIIPLLFIDSGEGMLQIDGSSRMRRSWPQAMTICTATANGAATRTGTKSSAHFQSIQTSLLHLQ